MLKWRSTPCIRGRPANESDVADGFAVFFIPSGSTAHDVELPLCAIQVDPETGKRTPCIAIQVEQAPNGVFVGVRYLDGGNGVGTADEFELISEPNDEFSA